MGGCGLLEHGDPGLKDRLGAIFWSHFRRLLIEVSNLRGRGIGNDGLKVGLLQVAGDPLEDLGKRRTIGRLAEAAHSRRQHAHERDEGHCNDTDRDHNLNKRKSTGSPQSGVDASSRTLILCIAGKGPDSLCVMRPGDHTVNLRSGMSGCQTKFHVKNMQAPVELTLIHVLN